MFNNKKNEQMNHSDACIICCNPIKIFAYGKCLHTICYKCSLRLRALCKENYCPVCRAELPKIIYSNTFVPSEVDYLERNVGDQIPDWGIYFNSKEIRDVSLKLLDHPCIYCPSDTAPKNLTFEALKNHLKMIHNRYFCDICVDHLKIFTIERSVYTLEELATHRRCGDSEMGDKSHKGHPLCEFCDKRYLDSENLYKHLRRDHYFCHFCEADGLNQYYNDYPILRDHFRSQHYLCEEGECQHERFVTAFRSEIDMKAHKLEKHSHGLDRASQRLLRSVDISFNYAPRSQREYRAQYTRRDNAGPINEDRRGDHREGDGQRFDRRQRRFESGTFRPDERESLRPARESNYDRRNNNEGSQPFPRFPSQTASNGGAQNSTGRNTFSAPEFYHGQNFDLNADPGFEDEDGWNATPNFRPDVDFPSLKVATASRTDTSVTMATTDSTNSDQANYVEGVNQPGLFMPKPFTAAIGRSSAGTFSRDIPNGGHAAATAYPSLPNKDKKLSFKSQFGINTGNKKVLDESFPALAPSTTRPPASTGSFTSKLTGSGPKGSDALKTSGHTWSVPIVSKVKKGDKKQQQSSPSVVDDDDKSTTPPGFTRISSKGFLSTHQAPSPPSLQDEFPRLELKAQPSIAQPKLPALSLVSDKKGLKKGPAYNKSVSFGQNPKPGATPRSPYFEYDERDDTYANDGGRVNEFHLLRPLDQMGYGMLGGLTTPKPNVTSIPATTSKLKSSQTLPRPYVQPPAVSDQSSYPSLGKSKGTQPVIGRSTLNPRQGRPDPDPSPLDQLIARLNGPSKTPTISQPIKATGVEASSGNHPLTLPFAVALERPNTNTYDDFYPSASCPPASAVTAYTNITPDFSNDHDFPIL